MISSCSLLRIAAVWIFCIQAALSFLAPASRAEGRPLSFDCESRLQPLINASIPTLRGSARGGKLRADRIGDDVPLINEFAEDYFVLGAELDEALFGLDDKQVEECHGLSGQLSALLVSYFERRLARDLRKQGGLSRFYTEFRRILAPWPTRAQRNRLRLRFLPQQETYLRLTWRDLVRSLEASPWAAYAHLQPSLETWTEDWNLILGADAPGAVLYESKRIALQASEMDPETLKIVLFHELSHLADPRTQDKRARHALSDVDAELFAWRETLAYLDSLEKSGHIVPEYFQRVRATITAMGGLEPWVRAVVASRTGD